ncbi:MAG: hypothetical protein HYY87_00615 [Candidatus Levybacteria bacterium]|nr:hypothetical protein [Candidatus Levybacteria bacterium]
MATLHKATAFTKKILKWGAFAVIAIVVLIVGLRVGTQIKEYFFPTPLPPPTVKFGKLSPAAFPDNAVNPPTGGFTYRLNTLSGQLPNLPTQTYVYKIVQPEPSLLALEKAQEKVSKMGFNSSPARISNTLYQWVRENTPSKKLLFDISSFNFSLSSDFISDQDILLAKNLPDENEAIALAENFLKNIDFPQDIEAAKTKTTLLSIKDQELVPATSLSKAKLIRVDFFQKDIDKLPIYYPNPKNSIIYALIAAGTFGSQIVEAKFFHHNISEVSSTYPLKTAEEAFSELKNSKAYLTSYFGNEENIAIKDISLGYYLSDKEQNYLLPVIVFEGNNGFFAFVEAIRDEWIEK